MQNASDDTDAGKTPLSKRLVIFAGLALVIGVLIFTVNRYLSFSELALIYEDLIAWRDTHWLLSVAAFFAAYVAAVAFSLPGASFLTLVGGFMFGLVLGSVLVVTAATLGAVLIFMAARTVLGDALRARAEGFLARMEEGFRAGEASYLLIMRLVPAVPFFIANLVPAFLGARTWTFAWTTFLGIIPGTVVFISIGAGMGEQLARKEEPDLSILFEPHILGPLLGLAALASLPLVLKHFGLMGKS